MRRAAALREAEVGDLFLNLNFEFRILNFEFFVGQRGRLHCIQAQEDDDSRGGAMRGAFSFSPPPPLFEPTRHQPSTGPARPTLQHGVRSRKPTSRLVMSGGV